MYATPMQDASFVAATSKHDRHYLAKAVGSWINAHTYIIQHDVIRKNHHRKSHRLRLGQQFEILSISSLQACHGQRYLIEACVLLRERNIPFRCRIVGDGEERPFLEQLIAHHQIAEQVQLLGSKTTKELAQLLPTAHCYIQPSAASDFTGGIPIPLMEAVASGLPTVATDVAGISELIEDGKTGYLMPPGDGLALAEALEVLFAIPEHGENLAKNGRALLLQAYKRNN